MTSITLYNKGKRVWTLVNAAGADEQVKPEASIEMEEAAGLRMLLDYPREFTSSKIAGPSSEDLARQEQSLRDRTANLDAREKALDEREAAKIDNPIMAAIEAIVPFLSESGTVYLSEHNDAWIDGIARMKPQPKDSEVNNIPPSTDKPKRGPGRPAKVEGAAPEIK